MDIQALNEVGNFTTKGLIALTPEIGYDQTAVGLSPATSVVFLIAK
jgi:hypothetical protein